jgi:hypothetical protein
MEIELCWAYNHGLTDAHIQAIDEAKSSSQADEDP